MSSNNPFSKLLRKSSKKIPPTNHDRDRDRDRIPSPPPSKGPPPPTSPQTEAPPAYSIDNNETPAPAPAATGRGSSFFKRTSTFKDAQAPDPYAKLSIFDTVFLIDDSGSMGGSNWRETRDALGHIVPICTRYDSDGVDIYFLNNSHVYNNVRSFDDVKRVFDGMSPSGITPTGKRLGYILENYMGLLKKEGGRRGEGVKPLNVIVITDGCPTDPAKLEKCLVKTAKGLDSMEAVTWQLGVQFFQVGRSEDATDALEELDNALSEEYGVRDMVDTISYKTLMQGLTGDGVLKAVLGSVDRRLDRKRRV